MLAIQLDVEQLMCIIYIVGVVELPEQEIEIQLFSFLCCL